MGAGNRHQAREGRQGQVIRDLDVMPESSLNVKDTIKSFKQKGNRLDSHFLDYINTANLIIYYQHFKISVLFFLAINSPWCQPSPDCCVAFCRTSSNFISLDPPSVTSGSSIPDSVQYSFAYQKQWVLFDFHSPQTEAT